MKLREILAKEVILQEFCDYLEESSAVVTNQKLAKLIKTSEKLIFEPFGIKPTDPKYFIAGSARLYLYPDLIGILDLKKVGDLDMVIPGEQEWENALQYMTGKPQQQSQGEPSNLKEGEDSSTPIDEKARIYVKKYVKPADFSKGIWRPTPNGAIEAFTKWSPQLAKDTSAKDFQVRSSDVILQDAVKRPINGYFFMPMVDIVGYKLALNRSKEQKIVEYLMDFKNSGSDEEKDKIKQKLIATFANDSEEADGFLAPALAAKV